MEVCKKSEFVMLLDLSFMVDVTYVEMHKYLTSLGMSSKESKLAWTMNDSLDWVRHLYVDMFNVNIAWETESDNALAFMREWITDNDIGDVDDIDKLSEELSVYRLDAVVAIVGEVVSRIVSPNPWLLYTVKPHRGGLMVIVGIDYRIEWYNEHHAKLKE